MIEPITGESLAGIKNPAFRSYAHIYADIERDFVQAVEGFGLGFATESEDVMDSMLAERVAALAARGARVENDCKSIHLNWISPACLTCRKGVGTETYLASTQCPRNCFFCFNPNQAGYEYYLSHEHDVVSELQARFDAGVRYRDLALTGGEPLLHPDLTVAFFKCATTLYPDAYTRLYTSGWGLDHMLIERLQTAGLSEIRFSVKLDGSQLSTERGWGRVSETLPQNTEKVLAQIRQCVGRIPAVMVEMPVMPDQMLQMKELLVRLNDLDVKGVNLLELCFPLNNAAAFARRGYKLKARPYRVMYDYSYAGGLPIDGSESACIDLLEFAADEDLSMGVHYCSLENKLSGQIYQQNKFLGQTRPWHAMSERDFFLKSAKVFGSDVTPVRKALEAVGERRVNSDAAHDSFEFPLEALAELAAVMPDLEVAVCYSVAEQRESEVVLREVAVFKTTAATFDLQEEL